MYIRIFYLECFQINGLERHRKNRFNLGFGMGGDSSVMQAHDLFGQAQSDSGAGGFCGEERDENFVKHIFKNTGTVVDYLQGDPPPLVCKAK